MKSYTYIVLLKENDFNYDFIAILNSFVAL